MTLAVDRSGTPTTVAPQVRIPTIGVAGPASVSLTGALVLLLGAWAALSVFIGPYFGFRPTTGATWQWTTDNWLLHLVPGAVAFLAGLMIMGGAGARRTGGETLAALAAVAAGIWLVIGPAVWPTFETSHAYALVSGAGPSFVNQVGADLGPGLLLAILGAIVLKASHPGRVLPAEAATWATTGPVVGNRAVATEPVVAPRGGVAEPATRTEPVTGTYPAYPTGRTAAEQAALEDRAAADPAVADPAVGPAERSYE